MKYTVERIMFCDVTVKEYCEVEAPAGLSEEELTEWMWDNQYEMDWFVDYEECTNSQVDELDWEEYE